MKNLTLLSATLITATTGLIFGHAQAASALIWNWSYTGPSISANGTFTTVNTPNALGFYEIIDITGTRNGELITGLQPTGTAIPGNEPFIVDNLVSANPNQPLTGEGFGYSTSGGNYANPFFADFLTPPVTLEYFSAAPFTPGIGPEDSEEIIRFSATIVPEPNANLSFLSLGLGGTALIWKRQRKTAASPEKDGEKVA